MTLRGWKDRLIESMSILERSYNREWLSLQSEILPFIENHWSILWPPCEKKEVSSESRDWKRKVCEALSRNKHCFQSSQSECGKKGYWKLKHGAEEVDRVTFKNSNPLKVPQQNTFTSISVSKMEELFDSNKTKDTNTQKDQNKILTNSGTFFPLNQISMISSSSGDILFSSKLPFPNSIAKSENSKQSLKANDSERSILPSSANISKGRAFSSNISDFDKHVNNLSPEFSRFLERNGIKTSKST